MAMITKTYEFSKLSRDFKLGLKDYSSLFSNGIPLKEFLLNKSYINDIKSGRTPSKFKPEYWNGEYDFITMTDVDTQLYILNETSKDYITDEAINNEKTLYKVPEGSLIISNAMTIGLSFIANREVFINQNVFHVNVNEELINKKFLLWYFNVIVREKLEDTYSAKYLSKREISRINIPPVSIDIQKEFETRIRPIEQSILELKNQIKSTSGIIDEILGKHFSFNYNKFEEYKNGKAYNTDFSSFSRDVDVRFSVKFHRPAGQYVISELNRITNKKIKNYIDIPLMTGKGISPKDYDNDGDYRYASMADISGWVLDEEKMRTVSPAYVLSNSSKRPKGYKKDFPTTIKKGDILMIRSGEGSIGKVALVENDIDAIYSDFVIRISFVNYNPKFAYFYFRTSYFQYMIETYKKGLGNNTNIFPVVLQNFPLPDVSLEEQEEIIKEINSNIEENRIIESKIDEKRMEIKSIINEIVHSI